MSDRKEASFPYNGGDLYLCEHRHFPFPYLQDHLRVVVDGHKRGLKKVYGRLHRRRETVSSPFPLLKRFSKVAPAGYT